jgi:hypothetical protein
VLHSEKHIPHTQNPVVGLNRAVQSTIAEYSAARGAWGVCRLCLLLLGEGGARPARSLSVDVAIPGTLELYLFNNSYKRLPTNAASEGRMRAR